jgi:hypothetical protein
MGTTLAIVTSTGREAVSDFTFALRHWEWSDPSRSSSTAALAGVLSLLLICVCLLIGITLCVATGTLTWAMETFADVYPWVLKVGFLAVLALLVPPWLFGHDPESTKGCITTSWYDQHGHRQEARRGMSREELRAEIDRQDSWISKYFRKTLPVVFLLVVLALVGSLLSVCSATGWSSAIFPDRW